MKTIKSILKDKKVYFLSQLPVLYKVSKIGGEVPIIICDKKLQHKKRINKWLKSYLVYYVTAGENLKDLKNFSQHINNILNIIGDQKITSFISLGGGSVGDFTGFISSIYKRGIPLIHIPSTWLAAIDSAHGGKTALNSQRIKNVLGSYCIPKAVFIIKELLYNLPKKQQQSAQGEWIKIALIKGGSFYTQLIKQQELSVSKMWSFLPQAIEAKLEIVEQDLYEKKHIRYVLNLGHTLGHILESHFHIPHGQAVLYGIVFSIEFSRHRFSLSPTFAKEISFLMCKQKKLKLFLQKIPPQTLHKLLLQDKKRIKDSIQFVFIKKPKKVFTESISFQEILAEIHRQKSSKINQ